jgi:ribosome recycling factor
MSTEILASAEQQMTRAVAAMQRDFDRVRTGAASASRVDAVHFDDHGRRVRLIEAASIAVPDPRQIVIVPWDPSSLRAIGTAISQSRIGLTPTIDGPAIRLYVPAMSEDRRRELVAVVRRRADQAKVELRSVRHAALASIRDREAGRSIGADVARRETAQLQLLTDRHVAEIDRLATAKEASILHL